MLEPVAERGFPRGREKSYPKGIEEKQEFSRRVEGEVRDFTPRAGGEVAGAVGVWGEEGKGSVKGVASGRKDLVYRDSI